MTRLVLHCVMLINDMLSPPRASSIPSSPLQGWQIGWSSTYRRGQTSTLPPLPLPIICAHPSSFVATGAYYFNAGEGKTQWEEPLASAPSEGGAEAEAGAPASARRHSLSDTSIWREQQRIEIWAREATARRQAEPSVAARAAPPGVDESARREALVRARCVWQQLDQLARVDLEDRARKLMACSTIG